MIIPTPLVSYANLNKECLVIGMNDRLEIWSREKFDVMFKENEENMSDLAESLFDNVEV